MWGKEIPNSQLVGTHTGAANRAITKEAPQNPKSRPTKGSSYLVFLSGNIFHGHGAFSKQKRDAVVCYKQTKDYAQIVPVLTGTLCEGMAKNIVP